jgi:hypothetical protein
MVGSSVVLIGSLKIRRQLISSLLNFLADWGGFDEMFEPSEPCSGAPPNAWA